jgi:hypothetical protein
MMNSEGKTNHTRRNSMPALQFGNIPAKQLRAGDALESGPTVEAVKLGTKYARVTTTSGRTLSFDLDADVLAGRMVPTEEEKAAQKAEMVAEAVRKAMQLLRSAAETHPMEAFQKRMAAYGPRPCQALGWHLDTLLLDSALFEFAGEALAHTEEKPDAEALLLIVQEAEKQVRRGATEFGSRSTSWASNAVEDAKRAAVARWLDNWEVKWAVAHLTEREVVA